MSLIAVAIDLIVKWMVPSGVLGLMGPKAERLVLAIYFTVFGVLWGFCVKV